LFLSLAITRRKLILALAVGAVLLLMLATPLLDLPERLAQAVNPTERLVPIYYVDTNEKKVAFSFDASWGAERTEEILSILRNNDIKTTFFLTGFWVSEYPELVKLIVKEGHEIGNHTATHPHLASLTLEQIKEEIKNVEEMIHQAAGVRTTLFRPPFGEYSNEVIKAATELGYKTIQWSIDSLDWQNLTAPEITERVTSRSHKGAIILFHNNGLHTAEALPEIIKYYREHKYEILPVSELIYQEDYYIDPHSGAQIKKKKSKNN